MDVLSLWDRVQGHKSVTTYVWTNTANKGLRCLTLACSAEEEKVSESVAPFVGNYVFNYKI